MTIRRTILFVLAIPVLFWVWPILAIPPAIEDEDQFLTGFAGIGLNMIWFAVLIYIGYSLTAGK